MQRIHYEPTGTFRRGRPEYQVTHDVTHHVGFEDSGWSILIPEGFVTDLASIPAFARWALKPDGQYAEAAIVHDVMYDLMLFPRRFADIVFDDAMKRAKVPFPIRKVIYWSVRLMGWRNFQTIERGNKKPAT